MNTVDNFDPYKISVSDSLPPKGTVVLTCIKDKNGIRNEAKLKLVGRLWFLADGSMYVYYTPTHWGYTF